jgi:6-phosphogluconolactonase/glucosamine-6-phosphate isomerase/deaminase
MNMRFIKLTDQTDAEEFLYKELESAIESHNHITWLVPGGSNIKLSANVFNRLGEDDLAKLTVMLTDERFGEPGHPDSNDYQLAQAGVDFSKVEHFPVLVSPTESLEETIANYSSQVKVAFEKSDYIFGQFGMGADGHTAGLLPHSPATQADGLVAGYKAADFTRVSLTFHAVSKISEALVFVFGENKQQAVLNLRDKELSLEQEPAQIFKQLPEAYIINDMIGDEL